jgi:hypothetical protein
MAETVPTGPYFGYNYSQLLKEQQSFITRRQSISRLIGSTVNGNSFQRESASAELRALNSQIADLQDAMHYLRPDLVMDAPSRSAAIRFSD